MEKDWWEYNKNHFVVCNTKFIIPEWAEGQDDEIESLKETFEKVKGKAFLVKQVTGDVGYQNINLFWNDEIIKNFGIPVEWCSPVYKIGEWIVAVDVKSTGGCKLQEGQTYQIRAIAKTYVIVRMSAPGNEIYFSGIRFATKEEIDKATPMKSRVRFQIGDKVQFVINPTMYNETGEKDLGKLNCKGAKTTIEVISTKHPDLVGLRGYATWYMENDLELIPIVTLQGKKSISDLTYPDVVQIKNQGEYLILKSVYKYLSEYKNNCDCYLIPDPEGRGGLGTFCAYQDDLYTVYKFNDLNVDLLKPIMPEKWCVKVNERIQPLVNNFLHTNKNHWPRYNAIWKISIDNWFYYPRAGEFCASTSRYDTHTEITPELFEAYIKTEREKLLAEAKKRYPEGTKFKSIADSAGIYISGGNSKDWINSYYPDGIGNDGNDDAGGLFYANGKWAEVVNKPNKYDTAKYIKLTKPGGNNTTHPEFTTTYSYDEVGKILKVIRFDEKYEYPSFICEGGYAIYPNYCEEVDEVDYRTEDFEVVLNPCAEVCKPGLHVGELIGRCVQLVSSGANFSKHPKCNAYVTPDNIGKIYSVFYEEVYDNFPCYVCTGGYVFYKDCCREISSEEANLWKKESFNKSIAEFGEMYNNLLSPNSKYFLKVKEFEGFNFKSQPQKVIKKEYFIKPIEI